jgi:hypothetical protein
MRSNIRAAVVVIASIAAAVGGAANAQARTSARADLIVGRLGNPPKRVVAGHGFAISDVVSNRGAAPAQRSVTRYYLTSGKRVLLAGTRRVPALAAHGRSRGRAHLTIRAGAPGGRYSLIACVDATRRVRERNERNNCRAARRRVAVPGPDGAVPPSQPSPPLGSADSDHDG